MDATGEPGRAPPSRKQLGAVALGNALEFYDFMIFSFFAIQIGETFFPSTDPINSLLAALATFGAGFLTRPLGAWAIGRFGDRAGRKPAMLLSFALIGVSSLALALVPSYAAIGVAAPVLVIIGRLVQGFALGGEVGPSSAFLAEAGPADKRGRYISLQFVSQGAAILASGIVGVIVAKSFSDAGLTQYGWRIALALGALIVPVGLVLRRSLEETLPPAAAVTEADIAPYRRIVVLGFFILLAGTIATYVMTYLTTYAQSVLGLPADISLGATVAGGLAYTLGAIAGGIAADRLGRRPVMLAPMALSLAMIMPSFWWLNASPSEGVLYTVAFGLRFFLTMGMTAGFIALTEGLPRRVRSGALALVYAIAISVFGGSTQFVIAWLTDVTGDPMAPAWYVLAATAIGLCAMALMRESRPSLQPHPDPQPAFEPVRVR
ncbi:MFS transporter [Tsuneonella sp. SYSU-LHT278]|uniref:MFS transporter n=1 Tax=Tsuneonella sediminis TaxID=3416089 RepID=UPI003F78DE5F